MRIAILASEGAPYAKSGFINVLNDGLGKVNFGKIQTALQKLWEVLAPFAIRVGEGLLWFWEEVLVPFGTWKANEVVPRFLDTLHIALAVCINVLDALQPLFQWFWKEVLKPLAKWTGKIFLTAWDKINGALEKFSDWCGKNPEIIRKIATTVLQFFAAWKGVELMSFIQQSGGVIGALNGITKALFGTIAAKMTDKAETMYLTALYAKDFVMNLVQSTAALARQAAQFVINTALKITDTAAQLAMTAATVAWNAACTVATVATTALGAAIAFLTSPIGLVIVAITAIIAAGVLLYKNWDVIKEKALKIWGEIKNWFGKMCKSVGEFFSGLWKKGIKETFSGVGNWFKEKFDVAYSNATGAFSKTKAFFGDIWKGIKNSFGNITEWFQEKFSAAWEAVKKVFSSGGRIFEGIKDGILSSLKAVINGLIRGINSVIAIPFNNINSALNALKNWSVRFGPYELIRPFSWLPSIGTPQIPQLAEGGFVKKNTPQLAMIGDNRHQGEVVAPEDKLREMAMEAVRAVSGSGMTRDDFERIINRAVMRIIAALSEMGFYLDGTQIARANRAAQEIMDIRYSTIGVE